MFLRDKFFCLLVDFGNSLFLTSFNPCQQLIFKKIEMLTIFITR